MVHGIQGRILGPAEEGGLFPERHGGLSLPPEYLFGSDGLG